MFRKINNRIKGVRYLLLAALSMFKNRFYAVADDIVLPTGEVNFRSDGDLTESGRLDSTYAVKNIFAKIQFPFNDWNGSTGATQKTSLFLYGRTTPVGDATYGHAPIGSQFHLFTISANVVTSYDLFIKKYDDEYGWVNVFAGSSSTSLQVSGTAVKMNQSRVDFTSNSCDNFVSYFRAKCSGTSQMVAAVRGYVQSYGNNTSITGGDFTGELDVAAHSNGHIAGVQAMCAAAASLTITSGALCSLLLTASLGSACTGLQHGGAAFIFLTDQNATYKVKYLIDANSDGSSLIDTGTGTSHLECYESDGMTFTCKGGYRIYTCGGGEMYIPFGTLAS